MNLDHPAALIIGAVLNDRRSAAQISVEAAARRLRIPAIQLLDIEAGRGHVARTDIHRLCSLYGVPDEGLALSGMGQVAWYPGMGRPGPGNDPFATARYDRAHGSAERLSTVVRHTLQVRWLAPRIPPPLRTPALAAADVLVPARIHWPAPRPGDVFILDERALKGSRSKDTAVQIRHLLDLREAGAQIHLLPLPPHVGEVIELTLPGGTVLAHNHFHPAYQATDQSSADIDNALAATVTGPDPLEQALAHQSAAGLRAPDGRNPR
ncbi:helix-turn-helix domain-containing protein [Streptomyces sp. NBRC 110465]|uniref:helix-turn-helix domain-containing protein n=1 Tax=Streptomyces sp. NBRC 110465 TaxID=1897621 RepID=UPI0015BBC6F3|nr:helix-turn-helix transcriptional regulator [Streptomyces sp. NBRC 110465]